MVAIAAGARAPYLWHRDAELEHSEPGISIAYRGLCGGFERRRHRSRPWDTPTPQKNRRAKTVGNINK
jgi:hypothetical protein